MADVARTHNGDCQGGPPGGGPPGGGWQPPSGCQGNNGPKKGQGRSRNLGLKADLKKSTSNTFPIDFEQNSKKTYVAVGVNRKAFATLLGTTVSKIPRHYGSWKSIPEEERVAIIDELESFFDLRPHLDGPNGYLIERGILKNCSKMYRDQKFKFRKTCCGDGNELPNAPPQNMPPDTWEKFVSHVNSPKFLQRSAANKAVRAKQKIVVRTGSKSLAQARYENRNPITNEPPSLIEEYARLRTYKGEVYPAEAADNYEKLKELRDAQVGVSNPLTEEQIMESVLGSSRGWQRGIGPKLPESLHCSSSRSCTRKRTYTHSEVEHMISQAVNKMKKHTAPLFKALNIQEVEVEEDDEEEEDDEGDEGVDEGSEDLD